MYSLRMSFWIVPRSAAVGTPCCLPTAMTMASSTAAGALMVMLMETLSSGMPSSSVSMSRREEIETPTLPTSPSAKAWSAS